MMNEKVKKIELEFAEARKEIMQLRVENRKLETALSVLSKPMVLSDDESSELPGSKRRRSDSASTGEAIVIALPQGEAQERIDSLLRENMKLADEISELRQGGNVSSLFEKNSTLTQRIKELEGQLEDQDRVHISNRKAVQAKADREARLLRERLMEIEQTLNDSRTEVMKQRDDYEAQQHEKKMEVKRFEAENTFLRSQIDAVYQTASHILANSKDFGLLSSQQVQENEASLIQYRQA